MSIQRGTKAAQRIGRLIVDGDAVINGQTVIATENTAPTDTKIFSGSVSFYLDEAGDKLKVRVRYSTGAYATGEISLTPD